MREAQKLARSLSMSMSLSIIIALVSAGCSGPSFDRRAMLRAIGEQVVLPTLAEFTARARALETAVGAFAAAPSEAGLLEARSAWDRARAPWKAQEAFAFGPVADAPLRLGPRIDFWPARPEAIAEVLAGAMPIDQAFLDGVGAAQKGMPVLEYLLFEPGAATLQRFLADRRRADYARALAADLARRAEELEAAWSPSGGDFLGELVDAGQGSVKFHTLRDAVNEVYNRAVFCVENAREIKLGKPAGKRTGGAPQQDLVESRYSDRSLADLLDNLRGAEAIYAGGYRGFLLFVRPALDPEVAAAFSGAREAVAAVPPPLRTAVVDHAPAVEAAFQAIKRLHVVLGVDVANTLAVTVTFNDTDGD